MVDDETDAQTELRELLRHDGYHVLTASALFL